MLQLSSGFFTLSRYHSAVAAYLMCDDVGMRTLTSDTQFYELQPPKCQRRCGDAFDAAQSECAIPVMLCGLLSRGTESAINFSTKKAMPVPEVSALVPRGRLTTV